MSKLLLITTGFILGAIFSSLFFIFQKNNFRILSPLSTEKITPTPGEKPLDKYTIENLGKRKNIGGEISFNKVLKETPEFTSYLFFFNSSGKKVSGMLNIPHGVNKFPVIVMFRGYLDRDVYETGMGTMHAADFFAKNGFITLAPDFLGYGESDMPSQSSMVERFQTYIVALDLLESVKTLPQADSSKIGIWGHSNGGQIALSTLEITQKSYPTSLWAPVSKLFPYSVLYYTDTFEDHGKALRKVVADFEKDYDVEKYSITNYFQRINALIQLHQGTSDDQVPQRWSDEFADNLKKLDKDVTYFVYPGADHNMVGSWDLVVERDLEFYRKSLSL